MELVTPAERPGSSSVAPQPTSPWPRWLQLGFIAAFLIIFLFSARLLLIRRSETGQYRPALDALSVQASDMPAQLGEWQVIDFEHKVLNDEFAPESSIWTVQRGTRQALVSIDGPYPAYHPLNICYGNIGWSIATQFDYDRKRRWDSEQLNATSLKMSKPDASGLVIFTAVDRQGQLVEAPPALPGVRHGRSVFENVKSVLGIGNASEGRAGQGGPQLPIYQIQVLYQTESDITAEESAAIEALFKAARQAFLSLQRFQVQSSS